MFVNSLQDGFDEGYITGSTGSTSEYNLSAAQPSAASVDHLESNLKVVQKSRRGFQKHEAAKIQQKLSQLSLGDVAPMPSAITQTNPSNAGNIQVNFFLWKSTLQMDSDSKG